MHETIAARFRASLYFISEKCFIAEKHYLRMLTFASGPLSMFDFSCMARAAPTRAPHAPKSKL
jgi:hypothetical protein